MLFIVQSPYWFTIGRQGVLSLGEWTPHIQSEFPELESTRGHIRLMYYGAFTLCSPAFQLARTLSVYPRSLAATDGVALLSFPRGT